MNQLVPIAAYDSPPLIVASGEGAFASSNSSPVNTDWGGAE
jgi:hypothetical protein